MEQSNKYFYVLLLNFCIKLTNLFETFLTSLHNKVAKFLQYSGLVYQTIQSTWFWYSTGFSIAPKYTIVFT